MGDTLVVLVDSGTQQVTVDKYPDAGMGRVEIAFTAPGQIIQPIGYVTTLGTGTNLRSRPDADLLQSTRVVQTIGEQRLPVYGYSLDANGAKWWRVCGAEGSPFSLFVKETVCAPLCT